MKKVTFADAANYTARTSDGRAFRLVKPELVGNIEYLDIITETNNRPIMQNVLLYNDEENSWRSINVVPFASLISPHFAAGNPFRTDKTPLPSEVRTEQVSDVVLIASEVAAGELGAELKPSKIIARTVFAKAENMVRKFLLWETNKGENYPKYVIYMLDYSAERAKPIQRTIRITNDRSQIKKMYEMLITENMIGTVGVKLKKGWTKVSEQLPTPPKKSSAP